MARHGNGTKNYRLAGWIWFVLVSILVIVGLIIGWQALRSDNQAASSEEQCPEGDYSLSVLASEKTSEQANKLAEEYNEAGHVVRDNCVKAQIETMSDSDALQKIRDAKEKGNGVSGVWIPEDPQKAAKDLKAAGENVTKPQTPVVDKAAVFALGSAAGVEEQAARAGTDFSAFAADSEGAQMVPLDQIVDGSFAKQENSNDKTETSSPAESRDKDKEARDGRGEGDRDKTDSDGDAGSNGQAAKPTDTTFLLDTSGSMGLYEGDYTRLDNIRGPLADAMKRVGSEGGSVGLWNYSSPLNPGVTNPYRNNVDVTVGDDGTLAAGIVSQLGFGGATHTYESIIAAYNSAVAGAKGSDAKSHRVVLITDGPNDGGRETLESAVARIQRLHGVKPVQLNVVSIGENVDAEAMKQLAGAGGGEVFHANDSLGFKEQLEKALG